MSYYDLHVHLLGSIPPHLVDELAQSPHLLPIREKLSPSQREFLEATPYGRNLLKLSESPSRFQGKLPSQALTEYTSLPEFLAAYLFTSMLIQTRQDFQRLVKGVVEQLEHHEITYAELTISPSLYAPRVLPLDTLLSELKSVTIQTSGQVQWILDPIRNRGPQHARDLLQSICDIDPTVFCGVNLGGDESSHPLSDFSEYYNLAISRDLGTTVHAGENFFVHKIQEALELPIQRIGHGLSVCQDSELLSQLRRRNIAIECCPSSNIRTGLYPSVLTHPIRKMVDAGLTVTINSDDPFFFQTCAREEFQLLAETFSHSELDEIRTNGKKCAFR
ncbi:MAG: hypothetical protein KDD60_02930 [Bdellovibrionales bacterium]|nr:hypothetical protein [Bdellovibrionales bacterium]